MADISLKDAAIIFVTVFLPLILLGFLFWAIVHFTSGYEGIASVGILAVGVAALSLWGREIVREKYLVLFFIFVFSFLGLIFDRAGNFVYNKPYQMLCPAETVLVRDVVVEENYDGESVHNQYFSCFSTAENRAVKQLSITLTVLIRFAQYILLSVVLIAFYWLVFRIFPSKKGS